MSKRRVTLWLEEETIEMLDGAVEEAARDPEMGDEVSRGMLARHLINSGVEDWSGAVRDVVPDALVEKYQIKYRKQRRKDEDYKNKLAAYWRKNVQRELTKMYDDEAPARPRNVRLSMEKWRDEAADVYDDGEALREDLAWLDRKLDEYEDAVRYAEVVPERGFDRVSGEIAVGADLWQLRPHGRDLVEDIEQLADGDAMDPDAIRDRLAADYGVSTAAIEAVIETIVRDDVDARRALKGEHGDDGPERFREVVDRRALGPGSTLTELPRTDDVDGEPPTATAGIGPDDDATPEVTADGGNHLAIQAFNEDDEDDADRPDRPDREPANAVADLARDELIEQAVQLFEAGTEEVDVELEIGDAANGEIERKAAIATAKERLAERGVEVDPTIMTDGGTPMDDEPETVTIRERIEDELDADRLHGLTVTRRQGDTIYCVATRSTTWDQLDDSVELTIPVLDVRTVVVDLDDDAVRVSDNGLWVPQEGDVATSLAKALARASNDLGGATAADAPPLLDSAAEGVSPELLFDREIEVEDDSVGGQHVDKMKDHAGIDPSRPWGYGAGPPPEVDHVAERLTEAGLDPSEHLTRLVWGKKEPMDRKPRPVDELVGNYGIELLPRESGLIAIDVDYPEAFPEDLDLPDTFEVSSPHGDDERRHVVLRCDDKRAIAEEIGAWAVQAVEWGDLWVGDRYLVGPGSQLSEFGCDDGEHDRGERGGCAACEDPASGFYEVVNDAPIATVEADVILDLVAESGEGELRNGRADNDPPEPEDAEPSPPACDNCGAEPDDPEDALKVLAVGDSTRRVCRGGCDG